MPNIPTYNRQVQPYGGPAAAKIDPSIVSGANIGQGLQALGQGISNYGVRKAQMLKDAESSEMLKQNAILTEGYYGIKNTATQAFLKAGTAEEKQQAMSLYNEALTELYSSEEISSDLINKFRAEKADDTSRFLDQQITDLHAQTVREGVAATTRTAEVLAKQGLYQEASDYIRSEDAKIPYEKQDDLIAEVLTKAQYDRLGANAETDPDTTMALVDAERKAINGEGSRAYPQLDDKQLDDIYKQAKDWKDDQKVQADNKFNVEANSFSTSVDDAVQKAIQAGEPLPNIDALAEESFSPEYLVSKSKEIGEAKSRARSIARDMMDYTFTGQYAPGSTTETFNLDMLAVKAADGEISHGEFTDRVNKAIVDKVIPKPLGRDKIVNNAEEATKWKNRLMSDKAGEIFNRMAPGGDKKLEMLTLSGATEDVLNSASITLSAQKDLAYSLQKELSEYMKDPNVNKADAERYLDETLMPRYVRLKKYELGIYMAKYNPDPPYREMTKEQWNLATPEVKGMLYDLKSNDVPLDKALGIIRSEAGR